MDFKKYDRARRSVTPLELDLVESYAKGAVSRRDFVKRGAVIGLTVPFMSTIIAACGSSSSTSKSTTGASSGATTGATTGAATTAAPGTSPASTKSGGVIKVASQKPAGKLDPVAMQDLGTYGIIAQCFEYLATYGDNDIQGGLAESWKPNADGSEWTFALRKGAKWHDGSPFTSADVAATMDRLVTAGNSGLKGVIDKGSVDATDPTVAAFKLLKPNGNFPYLVSLYNPQSAITPKSFVAGSTLDATKTGTGPFKLDKFDAATGATFVRNDAWWGGKVPLDGSEWKFFDDLGTQITAVQGGQVDTIVQFQAIGGEALLNDANFNVLLKKTATHRQIWMRTDKGQFKDKRVRQALAYCLDRDVLVTKLFNGKADLGNDHVIAPYYPFFDASQPQRKRDIAMAKKLLADAGVPSVKATLNVGKLQEIPDLAVLIQSQAKEAGFDLQVNVESLDTFYGDQWCPAKPADPPCSGASELGVVDYGHRAVPDVYLNAALATKGIWNSSQYSSTDFDAAFADYQKALDVNSHKAPVAKLQKIMNEDVPIGVPYFYNYLSGHTKKWTGIKVSALGQMFLDSAGPA